jgi:2-isopropylmalate synthase
LSHIVTTGKDTTNIACIKMKTQEGEREEVAIGSGPIYASFKAVDIITELTPTLESFSLNAVTDGEDAIGEAVVKLGCCGEEYTGRGLSTDVLEASIMAYINGINKIVGA